jgi:hypothetical protein
MNYRTEYIANFIVLLDILGVLSASTFIDAMLTINRQIAMNDYAVSIRHNHE